MGFVARLSRKTIHTRASSTPFPHWLIRKADARFTRCVTRAPIELSVTNEQYLFYSLNTQERWYHVVVAVCTPAMMCFTSTDNTVDKSHRQTQRAYGLLLAPPGNKESGVDFYFLKHHVWSAVNCVNTFQSFRS